MNIELSQALAEIDQDPTLSARQRIKAKAALMKDYRTMTGEATIKVSNHTSIGRVFGQSLARSLGRSLIKALLK